jgi:hypothetical protein
MDFHDDHTTFDTMASDEVSHMYVPDSTDDHGIGEDGSTGSSDHTDGGDSGHSDGTTVTVNTGGQEVTADATIDIDHDGHNDTAVVEDTEGHHIAVTDTDGDGEADHAALLDDSGRVLDTAHLDADGNWVQDAAGDSNPYGGPGASIDENPDDGGTAGDGSSPDGTGAAGGGSSGDGGTIVIESGGQSMDAQATIDTDHDGHNDTAVVQTADGNKVAFTDSDGDGHADQAVVYGPDGHMIGTAHYDEASGTWIEGAGDGAASGGDAVTQTAGGVGGAGGIGAASDGDGSAAASGAGGSDTGGVGTQTAGDTGTASGEQIEVTVGGHTAQVAASYDLDHDGQDETAVVAGPDGTKIAFSDTDGDGDADKAAVYDAAGKLVGTATYNEGSGTWIQDN